MSSRRATQYTLFPPPFSRNPCPTATLKRQPLLQEQVDEQQLTQKNIMQEVQRVLDMDKAKRTSAQQQPRGEPIRPANSLPILLKNRNVNPIPASAFLPHKPFNNKQLDDTHISERSRAAAQAAKDAREAALKQQHQQRQMQEYRHYQHRLNQVQTNFALQIETPHVYLVHREEIALENDSEGRLDIVGCFTTSEAAVKCAKSVIHRLDKDHDGECPAEILEDKKASFYAATIYLLTHPDHVKVTVVKMDLEVDHESYQSEEEDEDEDEEGSQEEEDDDDDVMMEEPTPAQQLNAANRQMRASNDTAALFLGKRFRKVNELGDIFSSKKPKTT